MVLPELTITSGTSMDGAILPRHRPGAPLISADRAHRPDGADRGYATFNLRATGF
jgi:hypothetical protein